MKAALKIQVVLVGNRESLLKQKIRN